MKQGLRPWVELRPLVLAYDHAAYIYLKGENCDDGIVYDVAMCIVAVRPDYSEVIDKMVDHANRELSRIGMDVMKVADTEVRESRRVAA